MGGEKKTRLPFVSNSELLARAFEYALAAHEGPESTGETRISHPAAVAEILAAAGFDEEVIAAALLHDVVEDTTRVGADIVAEFPDRVGELVAVMTEDSSIADYGERKAEHRERVLEGGRLPAAIYLADKLAKVRRFLADDAAVAPERLGHYRRTVELFGERDPTLPFLLELRRDLPRLRTG